MQYISKEVAKELNLSPKYGEVRSDGYTFVSYYKRNNKIKEWWLSPQSIINQRKLKKKRRYSQTVKIRNYIKRVKLFIGCTLCGYKKKSDALHFDHLDITTKHAEISKMKSYSIGSVKKEMRKCRVLCANCHAEHTATQREEGVFNYETDT